MITESKEAVEVRFPGGHAHVPVRGVEELLAVVKAAEILRPDMTGWSRVVNGKGGRVSDGRAVGCR